MLSFLIVNLSSSLKHTYGEVRFANVNFQCSQNVLSSFLGMLINCAIGCFDIRNSRCDQVCICCVKYSYVLFRTVLGHVMNFACSWHVVVSSIVWGSHGIMLLYVSTTYCSRQSLPTSDRLVSAMRSDRHFTHSEPSPVSL
jgi:hypothetical protein